MSKLRWKPLNSSVKDARALISLLNAFNYLASGFVGLSGVFILFTGEFVVAICVFILAVLMFNLLKLGYIALELLSQIADDTRLQLLAMTDEDVI